MSFKRTALQCLRPTRPVSCAHRLHFIHSTSLVPPASRLISQAVSVKFPDRSAQQSRVPSSHGSPSSEAADAVASKGTIEAGSQSLKDLFRVLSAAVSNRSVEQLRSVCERLRGDPGTNWKEEQDQCRDIVISALRLLCASGEKEDTIMAHQLLGFALNHWSLTLDTSFHDDILQGFLSDKSLVAARGWLTDMSEMPGGCRPSRSQWDAFARQCLQFGSAGLVVASLETMRRTGCPANLATYSRLFDAMFQEGFFPHFERVKTIVGHMRLDKVPFSRAFLDFLIEGYEKTRSDALIAQVTQLYDEVGTVKTGRLPPNRDVHKLLMEAATDKVHAFALLNTYIKKGFRPSRDTLAALCDAARKVSDLVYWEKKLGVKADAAIWAVIIQNAAFSGTATDRYNALEAYRTAGRRGFARTTEMFYPLLRALCTSTLSAPSETIIKQSLAEVNLFLREVDESDYPNTFLVYDHILRALTKSPHYRKHLPVAVSLVEDMRAKKVPLDSIKMTSLMLMLMNACRFSGDAFAIYKKFHKKEDGTYALDAKGYEAVVNAFCKRGFHPGDKETPVHYFEILKDMRSAEYPISPKVYINLLRRLMRLADALNMDDIQALTELIAHIHRIHEVIAVDGSLVPTVQLWNCLMETYHRVGRFGPTYELWQTMLLSSQFNTQTVNIILDACAEAGADDKAAEVYRKLRDRRFSFDSENWNRWLVHLCREGKIEEAVKVMCMEMQETAASKPTEKSAMLVFKYAEFMNLGEECLARIERNLPDLWATLPKNIRVMYKNPMLLPIQVPRT